MKRRRFAVLGALALVAAAAAALPAIAQEEAPARAPAVMAAVQVTANPEPVRAHSSPQLALNPTNGELVVVESNVRGDYRCSIHISADDGRSWFPGGDPMIDPWTECSQKAINGPYATLTFDPDGVLYVAFYANDPEYASGPTSQLPLHVFLARSEDGGRSFSTSFVWRSPEPVEEDEGLHNNDRPMIAVDQSNPQNVYVAWMQRGPSGEKPKALVAASTDGGSSFGEPVDLSDERGGYQARLAVTSDGTLHAIYPIATAGIPEDADPFAVVRTLYHRRSTDQGRTWSEPVEVDQGNAGFYGGRKWVLAADQNSGALYAAWYGNANPVFDPTEEPVDIFLRSSTDGGNTWSDRVTVNDDAGEYINHYDPGIAIAPNGRVDIAWYDFRNSPYPERIPDEFAPPFNHAGYQDVYYSWSTDGGRTFAPNVRVSDRIINREIGVWSNNIHSHMSVGIASTDEHVYVAWQDSRNGNYQNQSEDVYAATLKFADLQEPAEEGVPAAAVLFGGAGLALGMGVAMLIAAALAGRRRGAAQE